MTTELSEAQIQLGKLTPSSTALFLCDLQEKLLPAMLYKVEILKNAKKLVRRIFTNQSRIHVTDYIFINAGRSNQNDRSATHSY